MDAVERQGFTLHRNPNKSISLGGVTFNFRGEAMSEELHEPVLKFDIQYRPLMSASGGGLTLLRGCWSEFSNPSGLTFFLVVLESEKIKTRIGVAAADYGGPSGEIKMRTNVCPPHSHPPRKP